MQGAAGCHGLPSAPHEAVRLVAFPLSGAARPVEGEREADHADITAAPSLLPPAHGEMDGLGTGLLQMARGRGMTWPEIAFGLGLGSPRAARQRYERPAFPYGDWRRGTRGGELTLATPGRTGKFLAVRAKAAGVRNALEE
ncbi:hypothetical protein ACOBQB_16725 [Streptomyces sp. G5(2025)]|uniref:hypothetical protein n=1 Tax=Streptomyces sp. G5(2025) TaxID=3406628 RepID=UPI003C2168BC